VLLVLTPEVASGTDTELEADAETGEVDIGTYEDDEKLNMLELEAEPGAISPSPLL
jgi:hypothetical protein